MATFAQMNPTHILFPNTFAHLALSSFLYLYSAPVADSLFTDSLNLMLDVPSRDNSDWLVTLANLDWLLCEYTFFNQCGNKTLAELFVVIVGWDKVF